MPPFKAGLSNPPVDAVEQAGKTFQVSMPSAKFAHTQDQGLRLVVHRSLSLPYTYHMRGAVEVRRLWPFLSLHLPHVPPACGLGQVFVVKHNFSSFSGLAGPSHFWGGTATVEGNFPSDLSLDHCLSLLGAE